MSKFDVNFSEREIRIDGRRQVISALTGSHNYNLNDVNSDEDYKYFVMPLFEDLYRGNFHSSSHNSPTLDFTVHDVRKLPELFFKANLNFLEILYSKKLQYTDSMRFIFDSDEMKREITTMNLPYLWNACIGMHLQKRNGLTKGQSPQAVVSIERFGYDVKQAMHSFRVLDFLNRFRVYGDFKEAIRYEKQGLSCEFLQTIKQGKYTKEEVLALLDDMREKTEIEDTKRLYMENPVNKDLYSELQFRMEIAVKNEIAKELRKTC